MLIRTPSDLGTALRGRRRALGLGQAQLAERIGVARQWVVKIEAGKSTAELGLVLRALAALGMELDLEAGARPGKPPKAPRGISYDIDSALRNSRDLRIERPGGKRPR
jgi:HTH-type transcriptional regulator/antitoxin HipB